MPQLQRFSFSGHCSELCLYRLPYTLTLAWLERLSLTMCTFTLSRGMLKDGISLRTNTENGCKCLFSSRSQLEIHISSAMRNDDDHCGKDRNLSSWKRRTWRKTGLNGIRTSVLQMHWNRSGQGFECRSSLSFFFRIFFDNCLSWYLNCNGRHYFFFHPQFI